MKKAKAAVAATVVLMVSMNAGLFAADTNTITTLHQAKIQRLRGDSLSTHVRPAISSQAGFGYFNPALSGEYDPYPYYNIIAGETYGPLFVYDLPDQNESPFNAPASLSRHRIAVPREAHQVSSLTLQKQVVQPAPADGGQNVH